MGISHALLIPHYTDLPTYYVNSLTGSDSNPGTQALPLLTLDGCKTKAGAVGGIFKLTGSEAYTITGFTSFDQGTIILEGASGTWHCQRMVRVTVGAGGWTNVGGGIYSRTGTTAAGTRWWVTTLTDSNGFQRPLANNASTPTTPAAGEFGYSGSTLYVHLWGDVDPNLHEFRRASTGYVIRAAGTVNLTVRNCTARYANTNSIIELSAAGARLTIDTCTTQYSDGSGIGDSAAGVVTCTGCTSQRNANDGFNLNAATVTLTDCDGSYNDDEGASPHSTAQLTVVGGRYHHNFAGGLTAVASARMDISGGTVVDYNGAKAGGGIESNGINYSNSTTGTINTVTSRNNTGAGYYCISTPGAVSVTALTSGVGQGNTAPDTVC